MTQHPQLLRVQLDGGEVEVVDSGEGGGGDEVAEAEHELGAAADLHPAPRERRTRTWADGGYKLHTHHMAANLQF